MITSIKGILSELSPTSITIAVNGIGYGIYIPLSTFDKLPKIGSECRLFTYLYVREDALKLYGFAEYSERDIFKMLITISGIGPKLAITMLSGMSVESLKNAIAAGNTHVLSSIPGIGKKTALRIIVELKERIGGVNIKGFTPIPKEKERLLRDAVNALTNLGYKQLAAQSAAEKALAEAGNKIALEELLKKALKYL